MDVQFRRALVPREIRSLVVFDHKAFHNYPADWFDRDAWMSLETWWMLAGQRKIGCCAFERHGAKKDRRSRGSLYVASTGILPAFQGKGFGSLMKRWQISYALRLGFTRIATHTRRSNRAMIGLNRKFGFKILHTIRNYYESPSEAAVVMELRLPRQSRAGSRVLPAPM